MEAARRIAAEMYRRARGLNLTNDAPAYAYNPEEIEPEPMPGESFEAYLDRLYPKPDVAERDRLLRDLRIAIRQRGEAAAKMNLAAREYAYQPFDTAREERDDLDRTISILRGKLRDQFGISNPTLYSQE